MRVVIAMMQNKNCDPDADCDFDCGAGVTHQSSRSSHKLRALKRVMHQKGLHFENGTRSSDESRGLKREGTVTMTTTMMRWW